MRVGCLIYILGIIGFGAGVFLLDEWRAILLGAGTVWIIVGFLFSVVSEESRKKANAPDVVVHAKVISKASHVSGPNVSTRKYVSFEFDNRRENFEVDISQFNAVVENETGVLTYKEIDNRFVYIDFKRDT